VLLTEVPFRARREAKMSDTIIRLDLGGEAAVGVLGWPLEGRSTSIIRGRDLGAEPPLRLRQRYGSDM
jgi:hypothetical protein